MSEVALSTESTSMAKGTGIRPVAADGIRGVGKDATQPPTNQILAVEFQTCK